MIAPAVSVVISTYNRAGLLPRAIATVLAQTHTDFELIVIDDGSIDSTREVCRQFTDSRIRYERVAHGGVASGRNCGIRLARGEWVAFLDDDNEWHREYLERQLEHIRGTPDAGAVYCYGERRDVFGATLGYWPYEIDPARAFTSVLHGWCPFVSAVFVRRAVLDEVQGFRAEIESHEDVDLWLRVSLVTMFSGNPQALLIRHEHDGPRLSRDSSRSARSFAHINRMWRRTIISRLGYREYAAWFRRLLYWSAVVPMQEAEPGERRTAAMTAARGLSWFLPWSAPAYVHPALLLTLGESRYGQLRAGYRALARFLGVRGQEHAA
jgi:glycosyltransferase involved in cell wall biosynthesis